MNAAFLLITSAWLTGADPAPPPPPPAKPATVMAAPATYAGSNGSCGCDSGCNSCCEEEGFWSRLRHRFHRNRCEDSCNTCNTPSPCNTCNTCNNNHTWHAASSSCDCNDSCGGHWGGRLRGLFSHHRGDDCGCGCDSGCNNGCGSSSWGGGTIVTSPAAQPGKMPPAGEPIKAPKPKTDAPAKELPKGTTAAPTLDLTPTASKQIEETKNPFELDRRYESRAERAADYSWITGQLFYVHADGGLWVLRYAPIWKEEANGGSVVLARDVPMDSYREGDLVQVHGEILQAKASVSLGGPLYRIESIHLVDRPAQ